MMIICTQQLVDSTTLDLPHDFISVDPQNIPELIVILKEHHPSHLSIFDCTCRPSDAEGTQYSVGDHVNRTGTNPLIGYMAELDLGFIDVTHLYESSTDSVTTVCLGDSFPGQNFDYPSAFISNIALLARALGVAKIQGTLVNTL